MCTKTGDLAHFAGFALIHFILYFLCRLTFQDKNIEFGHLFESPPSCEGDPNLKTLVVTEAMLTTLPTQIGFLINLTKLDLFGNKIKSVPIQISHLTKLLDLK